MAKQHPNMISLNNPELPFELVLYPLYHCLFFRGIILRYKQLIILNYLWIAFVQNMIIISLHVPFQVSLFSCSQTLTRTRCHLWCILRNVLQKAPLCIKIKWREENGLILNNSSNEGDTANILWETVNGDWEKTGGKGKAGSSCVICCCAIISVLLDDKKSFSNIRRASGTFWATSPELLMLKKGPWLNTYTLWEMYCSFFYWKWTEYEYFYGLHN